MNDNTRVFKRDSFSVELLLSLISFHRVHAPAVAVCCFVVNSFSRLSVLANGSASLVRSFLFLHSLTLRFVHSVIFSSISVYCMWSHAQICSDWSHCSFDTTNVKCGYNFSSVFRRTHWRPTTTDNWKSSVNDFKISRFSFSHLQMISRRSNGTRFTSNWK